jgi:hypothetical protein
MAKTTANSIPTEMARLLKAMLRGKSKQKKERGIGVATGALDVVSEVHYLNKSNSVTQQNANKNVKRNDNNNTKSHPNTKKHAPSIATSTPQVSQLKSHNPRMIMVISAVTTVLLIMTLNQRLKTKRAMESLLQEQKSHHNITRSTFVMTC